MCRKWFYLFSIFVFLFTSLCPYTAIAAQEYQYIEVVKNNAPIRNDYYETGNVLTRCTSGTILAYTSTKVNTYLNKWYKVVYNGGYAWIYAENVKEHKHTYQSSYSSDLDSFQVCAKCGHVKASSNKTAEAVVNSTFVMGALGSLGVKSSGVIGFMGGFAVAEPTPAGEIALGVAIVAGAYLAAKGATATVAKLISELDLSLVAEMNQNVCSPASFREVVRNGSELIYESTKCLDTLQAYGRVLAGKDVYANTQTIAFECARLYPGGCYSEIDKNKPDYFYHYHLGKDAKHKRPNTGHVFYGSTPSGKRPK